MALWILNRPAELADPTELRVADCLARLTDDWVVRWGFHYLDNRDQSREGDFLVLGPEGGLMVIEVKAEALRFYSPTGMWNTEDNDHPLVQLDAEWNAVVRVVTDQRKGRPGLFVARALALPFVDVAPEVSEYHGIRRDRVISQRELRDFPAYWASVMKRPGIHLDGRSREIFFETFGHAATPRALHHFLSESDRILMRLTEANFELLDILALNRQLVIQGGAGMGKTWLAIELARRWAESGSQGLRVLLLTYNLALTEMLREIASSLKHRRRLARGEIIVKSWEELAADLLGGAGLSYDVPEGDTERLDFYTTALPALMRDVVSQGAMPADFDALVVDEAQDHDTNVEGWPEDWAGPGWWGIYWRLLREGRSARIAVLHDPGQRPGFRPAHAFDPATIHAALGERPVLVQLQRTVRYTRPLFAFLKALDGKGTTELVAGLVQRGSLPEGPEPQVVTVPPEAVCSTADEVVRTWVDQGLCRPEEILVLSRHGRREKSVLKNVSTVAGFPLVEYQGRRPGAVAWTSVHKAKGLDALAVVLLDFPLFEQVAEPGFQSAFFLGASRARQLLACIHATGQRPS